MADASCPQQAECTFCRCKHVQTCREGALHQIDQPPRGVNNIGTMSAPVGFLFDCFGAGGAQLAFASICVLFETRSWQRFRHTTWKSIWYSNDLFWIITFYLTFSLSHTFTFYLTFYEASILTCFLPSILTYFLAFFSGILCDIFWHLVRHSF